MKFEIVEKAENPLLKRTELKFRVVHENAPTPKRVEVKSQIAATLKVSEEVVVIEKLASLPGKQEASGLARVYDSRERLEALEPRHLLKRGAPKEEKPPAEEKPKEKAAEPARPAEEPAEARPEKPPEEKPAEEKPATGEPKGG